MLIEKKPASRLANIGKDEVWRYDFVLCNAGIAVFIPKDKRPPDFLDDLSYSFFLKMKVNPVNKPRISFVYEETTGERAILVIRKVCVPTWVRIQLKERLQTQDFILVDQHISAVIGEVFKEYFEQHFKVV